MSLDFRDVAFLANLTSSGGGGGGGGGGSLFEISPCNGTSNVLSDDTGGLMPIVGDVVSYTDGAGGTYCGTVFATAQSGTANYDIDTGGYLDCSDCNSSIGGGGGPPPPP